MAVFRRDNHTCRCCGFQSGSHKIDPNGRTIWEDGKYQQLLHINGDTRDFSDKNVLTTCVFCYQCFDLDLVAKMQSGMLIWLPEASQADLHHLARAMYIGRVAQGQLADVSKQLYDHLRARGDEAKKRLGSTDPEALAIVMRDFLTGKEYQVLPKKLEGIRLLPLDRRMITEDGLEFNQFPSILAYWRSKAGPFAQMPVQEWANIFSAA